MKKKVYVLTISGFRNYGNRLQAYALPETIRRFGFASTQLNFLLPATAMQALRRVSAWLYHRVRRLPWAQVARAKEPLFRQFTKEFIPETRVWREVDFVKRNIGDACYVVGSDQIWNPEFIGVDNRMFLQFAPMERRVAYAASFGVSSIPQSQDSRFRQQIANVPHISTREKTGASIVKQYTDRDVPVVLDPTMLLKKEDWLSLPLHRDNMIPQRPFILTYLLRGWNADIRDEVKRFASEHRYHILNVMGDFFIQDGVVLSPSEFVHAIAQAELVVSDSYHAAVFSVIMQTPLVSVPRNDGDRMGSRIDTLLEAFQLEDCRWRSNLRIDDITSSADFSCAREILEMKRQQSLLWLKSAIESSFEHGEGDYEPSKA